MNYTEEKELSFPYKKAYYDGLLSIIEKRQKDAALIREDFLKNICTDQEFYRGELRKMLGWPLVDYDGDTSKAPNVKEEFLSAEDGYEIYRMTFEAFCGFEITGLLFKQTASYEGEKKPLVIVQHGGGGTPEFLSGMYGSTSNYNDMLQRVLCHGVHVFAPQLFLWSDDYGIVRNRTEIDARLKRVGSSITAVEEFSIMRTLDFFDRCDYVSCFGMVGLSYGGFFTLLTTALDTRIKSAVSCAYFNSRDYVSLVDWLWFRSAYLFDDADIASLAYPRHLSIHIADHDEMFDHRYGVASYQKLLDRFKNIGTDWVDFTVFDGKHEFTKDDTSIKKLIEDLTK